MTRTYSSINATTDMKKIGFLLKSISLIILVVVMVYELSITIMFGEVHTDVIWHVALVIPAGFYNFIQIMGYGKHDILRLMRPPGTKRGAVSMLRSLFSHWVDLILIPMFVSIMLFLAYGFVFGFFSAISIIFISIYLIQMLPLKIKQEKYTQSAYLAIMSARDEMKTSRILLTLPDSTEYETKMALRRHIAAEEMISVHSNYLHVSASLFSMFLGGMRMLLPIAASAIRGIYQLLVVAGG